MVLRLGTTGLELDKAKFSPPCFCWFNFQSSLLDSACKSDYVILGGRLTKMAVVWNNIIGHPPIFDVCCGR